jgi:hypothetical protein
MLLYGHFGTAAGFLDNVMTVASDASLGRIFAGGILGPIGALLYIVGFWHVYLNTKQGWILAAKLVFICCTAMIVLGGTYHALWTIRMLLYKFGIHDLQSLNSFTDAIYSYSGLTRTIATVPGYLAFPILFILVLLGKTRYPRWTVIINPGLLIILSFLVSELSAPLGAVILGGYFNLVFVLFFIISVGTTWKEDAGA